MSSENDNMELAARNCRIFVSRDLLREGMPVTTATCGSIIHVFKLADSSTFLRVNLKITQVTQDGDFFSNTFIA